jgi:hypothetical protein
MNEGDDLDALPPDIMTELQKNIRDGSKDQTQKWANALELVHKAYEVAGVERPTPDLKNAWKQYEENLSYAVQQLAKYRGMDGDWRMSSAIFTEAALMPKAKKFRVTYSGPTTSEGTTVEADSLDEIINELTEHTHGYDAKVHKMEHEAHISYSKWGIKKGGTVTIRRVI